VNREKALNLIKQNVKNKNSYKHMLAVEAVMRKLARRFEENEEIWGIAGLVHDIDMEEVDYRENPQEHGKRGARILKEHGAGEEIINAAMAHNEETGKERNTLLEKAIFCTDPLTGLIVASALVLPSKKLNDLNANSVMKRYKEKDFAKGARRDIIAHCSEIGLELSEFISLGLEAMQEISDDLEL